MRMPTKAVPPGWSGADDRPGPDGGYISPRGHVVIEPGLPAEGRYGYVPDAESADAELIMPPLAPFIAPSPAAPKRGNGRDPFTGTELDQDPNLDEGAFLDELSGADAGAWGDQDDAPQGSVGYHEEDVVWYEVPPELRGCVMFGAVHTAAQCPLWIFRTRDEETGGWLETLGSTAGFMDLSLFLWRATRSVTCAADHIHGPQPLHGPVARPKAG